MIVFHLRHHLLSIGVTERVQLLNKFLLFFFFLRQLFAQLVKVPLHRRNVGCGVVGVCVQYFYVHGLNGCAHVLGWTVNSTGGCPEL
uniref:hypothetical protein n=1 Tax=Marinobacterium profundum TaxID=1714300 RepID=UPI001315785E|nr:hypothetical protein [Marinobacterium profundum]